MQDGGMSLPIDLRSDTVTRPCSGMRRAMAEAEVGDDVYGDDPQVNALQAEVAALLGVEAALWVPSGSMANQIALKVHCRHGDDVIVGEGAHNYFYESGAGGALAGVQFTIVGQGGTFTASELAQAVKPDHHHQAPTTLVCVENTHNRASGRIWPQAQVSEVVAAAGALGLKLHLDGARLWNAAAATGLEPRILAAGFDSVAVCLSKGLGAPAGSLICGSKPVVHAAHRVRKMLGGGMRQGAGILAAAGRYALAHHRVRLAEDHRNARALATFLAESGVFNIDLDLVQTNIVNVDLISGDAALLAQQARDKGVLCNAVAPMRLRLVTHLDINAGDCERAAGILASLAA
jgi:threonine aldolase